MKNILSYFSLMPYNIESPQSLTMQWSADIDLKDDEFLPKADDLRFKWQSDFIPHVYNNVTKEYDPYHVWMRFKIGSKGSWKGPVKLFESKIVKGPKGPRGEKGDYGPRGLKGSDGRSISIKFADDSYTEVAGSDPTVRYINIRLEGESWIGWKLFRGVDGVDGATGAEGLSAYEVALNDGFVGSETDWLNSLHGTDGVGTGGLGIPTGGGAGQLLTESATGPVWTNAIVFLNDNLSGTSPIGYSGGNIYHENTDGNQHIPSGGFDTQIITKIGGLNVWQDRSYVLADLAATDPVEFEPSSSTISHNNDDGNKHIPAGGVDGQILGKTASGDEWVEKLDILEDLVGVSPIDYNSTTGEISHIEAEGSYHIPAGGTPDEMLIKGSTGEYLWVEQKDALEDLIATMPLEFNLATNTISHNDGNGYKHIPHSVDTNYLMTPDGSGDYVWNLSVDDAGTGTDTLFTSEKILDLIEDAYEGRILTSGSSTFSLDETGLEVGSLGIAGSTSLPSTLYKWSGTGWDHYFTLQNINYTDQFYTRTADLIDYTDAYYTRSSDLTNISGSGDLVDWSVINNIPVGMHDATTISNYSNTNRYVISSIAFNSDGHVSSISESSIESWYAGSGGNWGSALSPARSDHSHDLEDTTILGHVNRGSLIGTDNLNNLVESGIYQIYDVSGFPSNFPTISTLSKGYSGTIDQKFYLLNTKRSTDDKFQIIYNNEGILATRREDGGSWSNWKTFRVDQDEILEGTRDSGFISAYTHQQHGSWVEVFNYHSNLNSSSYVEARFLTDGRVEIRGKLLVGDTLIGLGNKLFNLPDSYYYPDDDEYIPSSVGGSIGDAILKMSTTIAGVICNKPIPSYTSIYINTTYSPSGL